MRPVSVIFCGSPKYVIVRNILENGVDFLVIEFVPLAQMGLTNDLKNRKERNENL